MGHNTVDKESSEIPTNAQPSEISAIRPGTPWDRPTPAPLDLEALNSAIAIPDERLELPESCRAVVTHQPQKKWANPGPSSSDDEGSMHAQGGKDKIINTEDLIPPPLASPS